MGLKQLRAERLLRAATDLQSAFWDALYELEKTLDVSISANRDLSEWDAQTLYAGAEDDVGVVSRPGLGRDW